MSQASPSIRSEPPVAAWLDHRVEDLLSGLVTLFDAMRQRVGLPQQAVEIVIAEDVAAAVRSLAGTVVGVEALEDYSLERVGGVVAGKTMYRDAAHEDVIIVLDAVLFRSDAPVARVGEIQVTAHELAHALIDQVRAAGGQPMKATFLPWEVSRWLARYALEEHCADSIAAVVLGLSGSVRLEDGTERPLTATDFGECAEAFISAVHEAFTTVVSTIHEYRLGRVDLEAMWLTVQTKTSEMLISLAHAQAERDHRTDDEGKRITAGLAAPLDRVWQAMCECLGVSVFEGPDEFVRREQEAIDRGGAAIVHFWRCLGLTFRPKGDGFYIAVAPPGAAWPNKLPA